MSIIIVLALLSRIWFDFANMEKYDALLNRVSLLEEDQKKLQQLYQLEQAKKSEP